MNILNQIEDHGINISILDDTVILRPVEKVTPEIVTLAKANKKEIIRELKTRLNPTWCTKCEYHSYKNVDGVEVLSCDQASEPVYYLARCPAGFWLKDASGWPVTIN
ncbi:MAG: hypothetical protein J7K30_00790 [Deltaproteobacteria bacterium]|nr:hypothetical protein [Deltaproteobacteria bacterium]